LSLVFRVLSSSIGKKYVMALTGLLLIVFLVGHLAGNVFLYFGDEAYNGYAHALHEKEGLVKIAEAGLVVLFAAHIVLALITARDNRSARDVAYAEKTTKVDRDPASAALRPEIWMYISGAVVLGFLIVHLADFTWEFRLRGASGESPFDKAVRILQNPLSFGVYIVGSLVLGAHLWHGFASAFQSLGLNHPKYHKLIDRTSIGLAIVIGLGFAAFPLWAMFVR
jgi:succinate dehydrogenase / fumarate reductase cytochrome b subunit